MSKLAENLAENVAKQAASKKSRINIEKLEKKENIVGTLIDAMSVTKKDFAQAYFNTLKYDEIKKSACKDKKFNYALTSYHIVKSQEEKSLKCDADELEQNMNDIADSVFDGGEQEFADLKIKYELYVKQLARKEKEISAAKALRLYYFLVKENNIIEEGRGFNLSCETLKKFYAGKAGGWAIVLPVKDGGDDEVKACLDDVSSIEFDESDYENYDKVSLVVGSSPEAIAGKYSVLGVENQSNYTDERLSNFKVVSSFIDVVLGLVSGGVSLYFIKQKDDEMEVLMNNIPNPVEVEYISRISQGNSVKTAQQYYDDYLVSKGASSMAKFIKNYGSDEERQEYIDSCVKELEENEVEKIWGEVMKNIRISGGNYDANWDKIKSYLTPKVKATKHQAKLFLDGVNITYSNNDPKITSIIPIINEIKELLER